MEIKFLDPVLVYEEINAKLMEHMQYIFFSGKGGDLTFNQLRDQVRKEYKSISEQYFKND